MLNNLGLLFGRAGDMDRAERYFRDALGRRPDYGEAANNLALVFVSRGQADAAVGLLQGVLKRTPQYEAAYVTLARSISAPTVRKRDRGSSNSCCRQIRGMRWRSELLRQWKGR